MSIERALVVGILALILLIVLLARPRPHLTQLGASRPMSRKRLINILASLITAAPVTALLILHDAPTWAWLGFGFAVYLNEVKHPIT